MNGDANDRHDVLPSFKFSGCSLLPKAYWIRGA